MNMKSIAIILLLCLLYGCYSKQPEKTSLAGKPLPAFNLLLPDSSTFYNTSTTTAGKAVAVFYFATYCPYCRDQVKQIIDDMEQLKHIQFYFVSNTSAQDLKNYIEKYQLNKYPNIITAIDIGTAIVDYYEVPGVPYMALYTPDKKFKASYLGKISTKQIISGTKEEL